MKTPAPGGIVLAVLRLGSLGLLSLLLGLGVRQHFAELPDEQFLANAAAADVDVALLQRLDQFADLRGVGFAAASEYGAAAGAHAAVAARRRELVAAVVDAAENREAILGVGRDVLAPDGVGARLVVLREQGVWQSIPYMFADFLELSRAKTTALRRTIDLRQTKSYRLYLVLISILPISFLWVSVKEIQFFYGIIGACFLPLLALTLLLLNNRKRWVGSEFVNPWVINAVLVLALLFFGYAGGREIYIRLQQMLWPC